MSAGRCLGFTVVGLAAVTCTPFSSVTSLAPPADGGPPVASDAGDTGDAGDAGGGYAATVRADGPIAYWRLGDRGPVQVADSVGSHTGEQLGSQPAVPGLIDDPDTAFHFDGAGRVSLGTADFAFIGHAPYTVEAWVRPDQPSTAFHDLFKKETATNRQGYALFIGQNDLGANDHAGFERFVDGQNSGFRAFSLAPLAAGSIHHLVGVYDGTTLLLYMDGVAGTPASDTRDAAPNDAELAIGSASGGGQGFIGTIDEVALYDKVLPPDRIQAHYERGRAR